MLLLLPIFNSVVLKCPHKINYYGLVEEVGRSMMHMGLWLVEVFFILTLTQPSSTLMCSCCLSVLLFVCLVCLFVLLFVCLVCLSCLFVLFVCLVVCLCCCLFVLLFVCHICLFVLLFVCHVCLFVFVLLFVGLCVYLVDMPVRGFMYKYV